MYFSEITDDIYTIAEDESVKKKNFDNINRNIDNNIKKNDFPQGDFLEDSKDNDNIGIYVSNEVKLSHVNKTNNMESNSSPINKDSNTKNLESFGKPNADGIKSIPNKPNFKFNGTTINKQKEKDDTLVLSAIIDENEHNRSRDKINTNKNDTLIKNGLVYQIENKNKEQVHKDVLKDNNQNKLKEKKKVKDESLDLSEILSDNENKPKASVKTNDRHEKVPAKNEESIKFQNNNNHSISDISIHHTSKLNKNDNVVNENNSIITNKNHNTTNNMSKVSIKLNNGGKGIDSYIQKKVSQIESEFFSSKHYLEKMLLKDESKIIHYETKLDYNKVYDILKKQNTELVKNLEKMNNYMNTIIEGMKSAPKQVKHHKNTKSIKHDSEVDNKIIAVYKKEYNLINSRLTQISEPNYLTKLENLLSELNKQISQIEIDNKRAKVEQKQSEAKIGKHNKLTETDGNSEIKKINYDYEHFQKQFNLINVKINKNRDDIDLYNQRIVELNQNFQKLVEIGGFYGITEFDIKQIEESNLLNKNDSNSLEEKKAVLLKKIDIIKKIKEQNKNKHENLIKNNVTKLSQLDNSKKDLINELRDKSKTASGNNQKLKEFYERHRNHNVSTIIQELNLLNETMDKNNQNSTNYSTGNLARRQVLSRISEEIISENDTNHNSNNKNIRLTPIEERERDLEETIGKNKLDEMIIQETKKDETQVKQEIKIEDQDAEKQFVVKEKEPENDKYGIKSKPNFKLGKLDNKDRNITKIEKIEIKEENDSHKKLEETNKNISTKESVKDKQIHLEEIEKQNKHDSTKSIKVEDTSLNITKQSNNSLIKIEKKEIKSEIDEENIEITGASRRKKPTIIQQSTIASFLPIIENKEAKEKAEREKIRGNWSNISETNNSSITKTDGTYNIKKENVKEKLVEKDLMKVIKNTPNDESLKKEIIKENPKQEDNVPLFLQNYSNRTLIENKKGDSPNIKQDKLIPKSNEDKKDNNLIKSDNKNRENITNEKSKEEEKRKENKTKKEKKVEKPDIHENKPSLFSNIFIDDEDDDVKQNENETVKVVNSQKKKEDFDKLFAKDFQPKNNSESSNLNSKKDGLKQLNSKLDLTNKQLNSKIEKENDKPAQNKKKNAIEDLDDLII